MSILRSAFIISALMCFLGAGTLFAEPAGVPPCCQGSVFNDLNPEQKQQIGSLRLEFMKKAEDTRSQMAKKRLEMLELASKDKADESLVEKKRPEMWALQDQMRNERREFGTKIRSLLTPEQRQKIGPMGPGFGAGLGSGRGGFGGGGQGCGFKGGCPMMGNGRGFGPRQGCCATL
jgi:hypothetical protein